jgi:hypothetical protein
MKVLNLYLLTTFFSKVRPSLTPTKKICRDCRYFIANNLECGKFGDTNLVTGKVTYPYARSIREDVKKCGEDAIHFEENHFKIVTVPYYFMKDGWPIIIPTSLLCLYCFLSINGLQHK